MKTKPSNPRMGSWREIKTAPKATYTEVDLWLKIVASLQSFGIGDEFRVTDAYWKNGGWYHIYHGEEKQLRADFITHWMPIPKPPIFHRRRRKEWHAKPKKLTIPASVKEAHL